MCSALSAHTWTGRKIKSKLEELERMRSLSPDRDTKTMDVSAIKPASTARPAFSTPTSSHSAQPRFESAQRYSAGLWQQRSEAESSALPPVSCSFTMPPGFDCNDTAQSGYRALCAQCSLLFPWSGTPGSPNLKYDAWAPLASQRSGPFDEGYAAMNQAQ